MAIAQHVGAHARRLEAVVLLELPAHPSALIGNRVEHYCAQPYRLGRAAKRVDHAAHGHVARAPLHEYLVQPALGWHGLAHGAGRDVGHVDAAARAHLDEPLGHELMVRRDYHPVIHLEIRRELARARQPVSRGE